MKWEELKEESEKLIKKDGFVAIEKDEWEWIVNKIESLALENVRLKYKLEERVKGNRINHKARGAFEREPIFNVDELMEAAYQMKLKDDYEKGINSMNEMERINGLEGALETKEKVLDNICGKLADIRNLFDESDMEAEGHGMEDMVSDPYAVACYAESKIKRLKDENKQLKEEIEDMNLQAKADGEYNE